MIDGLLHENCCGCTACYHICKHKAITLQPDGLGFFYPIVDKSKCVQCGLCNRVCPMLNNGQKLQKISPRCYGLKHKEIDIRLSSSSGGAFSLLAHSIIEMGGVVYGAVYDSNMRVIHACSDEMKDISRYRGSKYVQSDLNGCFEDIKQQLSSKQVMFTGTPCQVMGLRNYLNKPYDNLITVDLICHGVASPRLFADYINFMNRKYKKHVISINMKDKKRGWLHSGVVVYFEDGSISRDNFYTRFWRRFYASRLSLRPSCTCCPYTSMNRCSDITIGDFWGVERKYPSFFDDNGVSLCLVNSDKGERLFSSIQSGADIMKVNLHDCFQQALDHPVKGNTRFNVFFADYEKTGFIGILKKYFNYTILKRVYNDIKIVTNL